MTYWRHVRCSIAFLMAGALVMSVACGKDDDKKKDQGTTTEKAGKAGSTPEDVVAATRAQADKVCACKDRKCADDAFLKMPNFAKIRASASPEVLAQVKQERTRAMGCSTSLSGARSAASPEATATAAEIAKAADAVCACKDPACAMAGLRKLEPLELKFAKIKDKGAANENVAASKKRAKDCVTKLMKPK